MNAGAYGSEFKDVLESATALDAQGGRHELSLADLHLTYRHSGVAEDWIFVAARFEGAAGDKLAIARRMTEIQEAREQSQPIRAKTGGSTFANPPGHKAWQLVDQAGCRGIRRGGAMISDKHANFLINTGDATAADIEGLGEEVRARVLAKTGITLHWEIKRVGDLDGRRRMTKRAAVLMGGWSAEREVSLVSGRECADALEELGYEVNRIDVSRDLTQLVAALTPKPDVVFNALHGRGGEDGTIQGVLEMLHVPYTHSGVVASAIAMHKPMAKCVFAAAGLPLAESKVVTRAALLEKDPLPRPFVIKPMNEGSSVGVHIVREGDNAWRVEIAAGIMAMRSWSRATCPAARSPSRSWATARSARWRSARSPTRCTITSSNTRPAARSTSCPRRCTPRLTKPRSISAGGRIARSAAAASAAPICATTTRRGEPGRMVLLEINTQPGMTPTSLVPDIANHNGISFVELVRWMVENAACDS